jgi:hypothetical protein
MATMFINVLKMKGLTRLPIWSDSNRESKIIDFNLIVPQSDDLNMDDGTILNNLNNIHHPYGHGCGDMSFITNYGFPAFYQWRLHNWGTPRQPWFFVIVNADTVVFRTSEDCPIGILRALGNMYPDTIIQCDYCSEAKGCRAGHITIRGDYVFIDDYGDDSPESINNYNLWNKYYPDEWKGDDDE